MSSLIAVDGTLIKSLRESRGLSQQELAAWACLSVKQVKQIEEGGTSSFYNDDIKRKATMRLAVLLDAHKHQTEVATASPEATVAVSVRAEPLHPLANPPLDPNLADEVSESRDTQVDQVMAPPTEAMAESDSPGSQRGARVMLWVSIVVTLLLVVYGLGFLNHL